MSESLSTEVPRSLQEASRANFRPIRRLPSPGHRLVPLVPLALATFLSSVMVFSLRPDASRLGWVITWGASTSQLVFAVALIGLALREAVPGRELSARVIVAIIAILLGFSTGLTVGTWHVSPIGLNTREFTVISVECFLATFITALPLLIAAAVMVWRAFAVRPWTTGVLYGLGAGAGADAGWRLFCHFSQPAHVLVSHTAGMIAAGLLGAALSSVLARVRWRAGRHHPE
jgi:Negative regulator of sigma F